MAFHVLISVFVFFLILWENLIGDFKVNTIVKTPSRPENFIKNKGCLVLTFLLIYDFEHMHTHTSVS